jgi:putative addiction module killer protein
METRCKDVIIYTLSDGTRPFLLWLASLKDMRVRDAVEKRIERLRFGNYGDCKSVGEGVLELRFLGLGLRIYFAEAGNALVLILCGGGKNTVREQKRDIEKAHQYWRIFKDEGERHGQY